MYFLPFIQHCKYLKHAYRFFWGNKYLIAALKWKHKAKVKSKIPT